MTPSSTGFINPKELQMCLDKSILALKGFPTILRICPFPACYLSPLLCNIFFQGLRLCSNLCRYYSCSQHCTLAIYFSKLHISLPINPTLSSRFYLPHDHLKWGRNSIWKNPTPFQGKSYSWKVSKFLSTIKKNPQLTSWWKNTESFFLKIIRQRYLYSPLLLNTVLEVLSRAIRQENKQKASLFTDEMILYTENPKTNKINSAK